MKNSLTGIALLTFALAASSCSNYGPAANQGAATGALLGAGAGAVIGHQSGHTGEGALIGAGSGALLGGAYGNSVDQQRRGY